MGRSERDALHEIIRQASYLPAHSEARVSIEDAASAALRLLNADEARAEGTASKGANDDAR